jgi:hypothetical protein
MVAPFFAVADREEIVRELCPCISVWLFPVTATVGALVSAKLNVGAFGAEVVADVLIVAVVDEVPIVVLLLSEVRTNVALKLATLAIAFNKVVR